MISCTPASGNETCAKHAFSEWLRGCPQSTLTFQHRKLSDNLKRIATPSRPVGRVSVKHSSVVLYLHCQLVLLFSEILSRTMWNHKIVLFVLDHVRLKYLKHNKKTDIKLKDMSSSYIFFLYSTQVSHLAWRRPVSPTGQVTEDIHLQRNHQTHKNAQKKNASKWHIFLRNLWFRLYYFAPRSPGPVASRDLNCFKPSSSYIEQLWKKCRL